MNQDAYNRFVTSMAAARVYADLAFESNDQRGTANIAIKQTRQNLEDAFDQLPEYARNEITAIEQQFKSKPASRENA